MAARLASLAAAWAAAAAASSCVGNMTNTQCASCDALRGGDRWRAACRDGHVDCSIDQANASRSGNTTELFALWQCGCGAALSCMPCELTRPDDFFVQSPLRCGADGTWECAAGEFRDGFYEEDCGPDACLLPLSSEHNTIGATVCVNGSFACEFDADGQPLGGCQPPAPAPSPTPGPTVNACGGCFNGGVCRDQTAGAADPTECWCLGGFVGRRCQHLHCAEEFFTFCTNGGCNATDGFCRCADGFYGARCDLEAPAGFGPVSAQCVAARLGRELPEATSVDDCAAAALRLNTSLVFLGGLCVAADDGVVEGMGADDGGGGNASEPIVPCVVLDGSGDGGDEASLDETPAPQGSTTGSPDGGSQNVTSEAPEPTNATTAEPQQETSSAEETTTTEATEIMTMETTTTTTTTMTTEVTPATPGGPTVPQTPLPTVYMTPEPLPPTPRPLTVSPFRLPFEGAARSATLSRHAAAAAAVLLLLFLL